MSPSPSSSGSESPHNHVRRLTLSDSALLQRIVDDVEASHPIPIPRTRSSAATTSYEQDVFAMERFLQDGDGQVDSIEKGRETDSESELDDLFTYRPLWGAPPNDYMSLYRETRVRESRAKERTDSVDRILPSRIITSENAQHHLPPDACIFVANLPRMAEDVHIKSDLEISFARYGTVYVKVRRDQTNLPVAFVQFTTTRAAQVALESGHGIQVAGRPIRMEKAKCDRTLLCSHKYQDELSADDIHAIRELVEKFGPVDTIYRVPQDDKSLYYLPEGVWIRFKLYGSCQDAYKRLCRHTKYRFELFRDRSPKFRLRPYPSSKVPSAPASTQQAHPLVGIKGLHQSFRFGSIIFVDGLPTTSTKAQLYDLFSHFGTIVYIHIHQEMKSTLHDEIAWRNGWVAFKEDFAGPAAHAFSVRHGFSMQDAAQLLWCHLLVEVTHVSSGVFNHELLQTFDYAGYSQYMHALPNPLLATQPDVSKKFEYSVTWEPTGIIYDWMKSAPIKALAPALGAPVTPQHAMSLSATNVQYRDYGCDHLVTPFGRAIGYGLAQRLYGYHDTQHRLTNNIGWFSPEPPSGMSPIRI
ncbi:hypothetical protein CAC42_7521 [Sphaceloma murrayae]|uniref:RRM domain-containing protein n=1 Tax=Sphaceloma murrayae TaxID=2082308 RepID=A0A2K1QXA2_9PEZI|nr:hypothetical protein CAC42_7521 [Sphaceloma murrayae]